MAKEAFRGTSYAHVFSNLQTCTLEAEENSREVLVKNMNIGAKDLQNRKHLDLPDTLKKKVSMFSSERESVLQRKSCVLLFPNEKLSLDP